MRRLSFLIAITALAGLPAPASAKEVMKATVCGTDGCHATTDRSIQALHDNGPGGSPPKSVSGYYTLRLRVGDGRRAVASWTTRYIPAANMIQSTNESGEATWVSLTSEGAAVLGRLARGLRPFLGAKLDLSVPPRPKAQVDEVFAPGSGAASGDAGPTAPADGGDGFPWLVTLGGLAGAGALAAIARALLRRRRLLDLA